MKMAKASDAEIAKAIRLLHLVEAVCHPRPFSVPEWPEDSAEAGRYFNEENREDLKAFFDEVKELSGGLSRILYGYQVLLDNCCDPEADTLEWKPEIAAKLLAHADA